MADEQTSTTAGAEGWTRSILVPTDFSKASELALHAAAQLARQNGARVTLVHVHDPSWAAWRPIAYPTEVQPEAPPSEPELEQRIHEKLRELCERVFEGVPCKTAVVLCANAAQGITDYAEKEDVDLIVISTHGRSGLAGLLIGSVAERVVRHAPCPVLTLRSKAKD